MEAETNDQPGQERPRRRSRFTRLRRSKEANWPTATRSKNKRLAFARDSIEPQIASKQAAVDQVKALAKLKTDQVDNCTCAPAWTGVLQQLPVEVGQRVIPGTNLARVADPTKLKAQVKIAETQAKDIQNRSAGLDRHA